MQEQQARHLSDALKTLRQRQRISQPVLAALSGISRTTIANIERGLDPMTRLPPSPRADTLRALARGLATDGHGVVHPELESPFYAELLEAAGYLPESFDMAAYLRGRVIEKDIPDLVAKHAHEDPEVQRGAADDYIAMAERAQRRGSARAGKLA